MKKLISAIAVFFACLTLSACARNTDDCVFTNLELVNPGLSDRYLMDNLEMLEDWSNIAVVGKFVGDTVQDIEYQYDAYFEKDIVTGVMSENTIEVSRVLMGDINVGDELRIVQRYAVVDGQLITFSDLTPMQKGDEWVFFLRKVLNTDKYICSADYQSRFPVSGAENALMPLSDSSELGVYEKSHFDKAIYDEIVEKYGI